MINIAARMQSRETCDAHRNCKGSRLIPSGNVSSVMVGCGFTSNGGHTPPHNYSRILGVEKPKEDSFPFLMTVFGFTVTKQKEKSHAMATQPRHNSPRGGNVDCPLTKVKNDRSDVKSNRYGR